MGNNNLTQVGESEHQFKALSPSSNHPAGASSLLWKQQQQSKPRRWAFKLNNTIMIIIRLMTFHFGAMSFQLQQQTHLLCFAKPLEITTLPTTTPLSSLQAPCNRSQKLLCLAVKIAFLLLKSIVNFPLGLENMVIFCTRTTTRNFVLSTFYKDIRMYWRVMMPLPQIRVPVKSPFREIRSSAF